MGDRTSIIGSTMGHGDKNAHIPSIPGSIFPIFFNDMPERTPKIQCPLRRSCVGGGPDGTTAYGRVGASTPNGFPAGTYSDSAALSGNQGVIQPCAE